MSLFPLKPRDAEDRVILGCTSRRFGLSPLVLGNYSPRHEPWVLMESGPGHKFSGPTVCICVLIKDDIPHDEITRERIKRHNLKRLGDQQRNWKHALKAKHFDKSKTATQIVAEAPNIVNRQDYAKLVDSWFRGNTIRIMHMRRYVFVIIFLFQQSFDIFSKICLYIYIQFSLMQIYGLLYSRKLRQYIGI